MTPFVTAAKFWARIRKSDSCWIWTGATNSGYGHLNWQGQHIYAHRLAWLLTFGETTLLVCHRCDNRLCCRPDHLFVGTHEDNTNDAIAKGRMIHDKANGRFRKALLSE